ncbi:hypothetical protein FB451DRAFT_1406823 [Mycena latifolia]|nr:hypothetical protein FB451DRAFT_1406823 [Mycena latifolia]
MCYYRFPEPPKQPPIRGVLARFRQRTKKNPTQERRTSWVSLLDDLPGDKLGLFSRVFNRYTVDTYFTDVLDSYPFVSEVAVESVVFHLKPWSGHAFLICHLRHWRWGRSRRVSLLVQRFGHVAESNVSQSSPCLECRTTPSFGETDRLTVKTYESDTEIIEHHIGGHTYLVCRTLTFAGPRPAPTLVDFITLAKLVSDQNPIDGTYRSCAFYETAIYSSLEKIFEGHSEEGPNYTGVYPAALSLLNPYDAEVTAVVNAFLSAKSDLQSKMDLNREIASLREEDVARIVAELEDRDAICIKSSKLALSGSVN